MDQAITTKYHQPTNKCPARVIATARHTNGKIVRHTQAYDHSLKMESAHRLCAEALAHRLEWSGYWVGGKLKAGQYVWTRRDLVSSCSFAFV